MLKTIPNIAKILCDPFMPRDNNIHSPIKPAMAVIVATATLRPIVDDLGPESTGPTMKK
ncbi:MAG: hypothetical protein QG549_108 [Patescibacteria group bacterium]|nr:hypothetical protein [Patescibacteria group bacterium]